MLMNDLSSHAVTEAELSPDGTALFLDLDGTVAEFQTDPAEVRLDPPLLKAILILQRKLGGALAVISGRRIGDLDRLLLPLKLPLAGQHGRERRDAAGHCHRLPADPDIEAVRPRIAAFAAEHEGVVLEDKRSSLALHYRRAPRHAAAVRAFADRLVADVAPTLRVLEGKMVVELIGSQADKGTAIAAFMAEPPFRGRRPVFLGDDVTDEDGFRAVNAAGGLSIKIGEGPTAAQHRLPDVAAAAAWLRRFAEASAPAGAEPDS